MLVLHNASAVAVQSFVKSPSHGLLVVGDEGAGKKTVAIHITEQLLGRPVSLPDPSVWYEEGLQAISIERMRTLQQFLRLRVPGQGSIRRIALIESADKMTHEAQNALLKTLEEPPQDTVIILTSSQPRRLLPTVLSRLHLLRLQPISVDQALDLFKTAERASVVRAYHLADGLPGLMNALLEDGEAHSLSQAAKLAKHWLTSTHYERLLTVDRLLKNPEGALQFLNALEKVCHYGMVQAVKTDKTPQSQKLHRALKQTLQAQHDIVLKATPKLVLTSLALSV